jgi:ubiquinone/menaquinone biosynthesis C-methylase UbiE
MSAAQQFDEAASRRIEVTYSTPDIIEQRRIVRAALGLKPGQDVLDIGSGPGFLACEMAEAVGPGGSVRGIDPSDAMLSVARRRTQATGSARSSSARARRPDSPSRTARSTSLPRPRYTNTFTTCPPH